MIRKLVRFLVAPLMIVFLIDVWLLVRFFEYVDEPFPNGRISDDIKEEIKHFAAWLIFKNRF